MRRREQRGERWEQRGRRDQGGQAAVELALVLPVLAVLLLAVVQTGLVVRDQVLVVHAAREAARAVAVREGGVTPGPHGTPTATATATGTATATATASADSLARAAALAAAGRTLKPDRLSVEVSERGGRVAVRVSYRTPLDLPLVRFAARDVYLAAYAEMRREIN